MENLTLENFLTRKRVGLILRVFAQNKTDIPNRIAMLKDVIEAAESITIGGGKIFSRIDIMVWADDRYTELREGEKVVVSDCGQTYGILQESLSGRKNIHVHNYVHGDIFCGILNTAVAHQVRDRIDYSMIISPDAHSYFTVENIISFIKAACAGALAIGLAVNELTQSVIEGRLANTFAMWHTPSLIAVGGFDLRAAKPRDEKSAFYLKGWKEEKGEVYYQLAGVEEVIPLCRLVQTYGQCLAPILPSGAEAKYQLPTDPELLKRHWSKLGTKAERQIALAATIGFDITYLLGGIMPNYRYV